MQCVIATRPGVSLGVVDRILTERRFLPAGVPVKIDAQRRNLASGSRPDLAFIMQRRRSLSDRDVSQDTLVLVRLFRANLLRYVSSQICLATECVDHSQNQTF